MQLVSLEEANRRMGWEALQIEVSKHIRNLAEENPWFMYKRPGDGSSCHYNKAANAKAGPGCIIGQAFERAGVDVSDFTGAIGQIIDTRLQENAPGFWVYAQKYQDNGTTWESAVRCASAAGYSQFEPARTGPKIIRREPQV